MFIHDKLRLWFNLEKHAHTTVKKITEAWGFSFKVLKQNIRIYEG